MNANAPDSSTPEAPTLVVFCRRPALGAGKQRIAADLGDARTLELADHLLATTLEDAREWPGPVILAPAGAGDANWARRLLPRTKRVIPQPTGNLGTRINTVDRIARDSDDRHIIYIGSDAPILTADYFARARSALATHDVVLGPAEDGGVTLMGAGTAWPDLEDLPWSTAQLGDQLEQTCVRHGLTVCRLEKSYDIDLARDLPKLYDDLADDPRPARRELRRWLAESKLTESGAVAAGILENEKY
jgi:rSAM/selenodomain-associated transferase 1